MPGFGFHPEASIDLDEIWEFIAADSHDAADRVIEEIANAIDAVVVFPHQGCSRPNPTTRAYPVRNDILPNQLEAKGARRVYDMEVWHSGAPAVSAAGLPGSRANEPAAKTAGAPWFPAYKKPLWIVAIFHGRRSPRVIAAILRGREQ
jgi:plasmid stabilization system protein ParE